MNIKIIFISLFILSCQTKEQAHSNGIVGFGRLYYQSKSMQKHDGRLDSKFIISNNGHILSKTNYDTGYERKPSLSKYSYHSNNKIKKIEYYSENTLRRYEEFNKRGDQISSVDLIGERGFREDVNTFIEYNEEDYPVSELTIISLLKNDSIVKKDSTRVLYKYYKGYSSKVVNYSNDTSKYITNYTFDKNRCITDIKTTNTKNNFIRFSHFEYDNKCRVVFKSVSKNHWLYKYNEKNLITELQLYLSDVLQYTIRYEYENLNQLGKISLPKEMIKIMLKN